MARTDRLTLAEIESALRDMAYNGGPFTYYGVLAKMRELAEKDNDGNLQDT